MYRSAKCLHYRKSDVMISYCNAQKYQLSKQKKLKVLVFSSYTLLTTQDQLMMPSNCKAKNIYCKMLTTTKVSNYTVIITVKVTWSNVILHCKNGLMLYNFALLLRWQYRFYLPLLIFRYEMPICKQGFQAMKSKITVWILFGKEFQLQIS